ncbi:MAG: tetratricopeptide repeat protein, partial [Spirochaetales bacterium]
RQNPPEVVVRTQTDKEKEQQQKDLENLSAREKEKALKVRSLLDSGIRYLQQGDYLRAKSQFQEALGLDPDSGEAYARLGETFYLEDRKNPDNVEKALLNSNKAIGKDPNLWIPHNTLGQIYKDAKNYDQAIREFKDASRLNPEDYLILYDLGTAQYNAKRYEEARQSFEGSINKKPDFANAHYRLGKSLTFLNDDTRALASFRRTVQVDSNFDLAHYEIGELLRKKGDYANAIVSYKKAYQVNPQQVAYAVQLGTALFRQENFREAEIYFEKAVQISPMDALNNYNLSQVKLRLDNLPEAMTYAAAAVKLKPNSALYLYTLAEVSEKLGIIDQAVSLYTQAIKEDRTYVKPYINLGVILMNQDNMPEARKNLLEAYRLDDRSLEVNTNLGNLYFKMELFDDSVRHYEKALAQAPADPDIRYKMAIGLIKTRQFTRAMEEFTKLIKLSPNYWDAYYQQGLLMIQQGNEAAGKTILTMLLEKNPAYEKKDEIDVILKK